MNRAILFSAVLTWLIAIPTISFAQDSSAPVTLKNDPATVTLSNGILSVSFWKKSAQVAPSTQPAPVIAPTTNPATAPGRRGGRGAGRGGVGGGGPRNGEGASILYTVNGKTTELSDQRRAIYFDSGGDRVYPVQDGDMQIVTNTPDVAEILWPGAPENGFNFQTEFHIVMRRGVSGYYMFVVYKHPADLPAANNGETRIVLYGARAQTVFTNHIVDDIRQADPPQGRWTRTVQDTTWQWPDGTIYTKYNDSAFMAEHHVHGLAGHGIGEWMITPSNEYIGGGPYKQDLMVHQDNTLLAMFIGGHFGATGIRVNAGQDWDKVFGPVFLYYNHSENTDPTKNLADLWTDAKAQAGEQIKQWPYQWLKRDDYPLDRGTVTGQIKLTDGTPTKGAWAMLVPPNEDWQGNVLGYDFWSPVDADGKFKIEKVRPGTYALVVCGADQFEPFRQENVIVTAASQDLGTINWKPVTHGTYLWQIGYADRSSAEFKHGDDARHWENFAYYVNDFPNDLNFTIGKSDFTKDWNYAQWSRYMKVPYWAIHFNLPQALSGKATLTIGLASSIPATGGIATDNAGMGGVRANFKINVNGQLVDSLQLPKTGMAGYRSGNQDSQYHYYLVTFDANLLKAGDNEIQLAHGSPTQFPSGQDALQLSVPGEVMYDAIRMEVDSPDAKPLMPRVPAPVLAAPYDPGPNPTSGLKSAMVP